MPVYDALLGKRLRLVILEPYEIATPLGDEPLSATVGRFVEGQDGHVYAHLSLHPPLRSDTQTYSELFAAPRHVGKDWGSLLGEGSISVQLGTGAVKGVVKEGQGMPSAEIGPLVAVGHLRRQDAPRV